MDAVVYAIVLASVSFASTRLRTMWRQPTPPRTAPSWWLWGDGLWRGWVRALPVGIVSGWPFAVAALWGLGFVMSDSVASSVGLLVSAALVLVGFGLTLSIIMFNAPRAFVPPAFRHDVGLVRAWLDRRQ